MEGILHILKNLKRGSYRLLALAAFTAALAVPGTAQAETPAPAFDQWTHVGIHYSALSCDNSGRGWVSSHDYIDYWKCEHHYNHVTGDYWYLFVM